jgi:hypothetical protein
MRKTVVLLLGAAFVASLPAIASAKSKHHRHHRHVAAAPVSDNAGPRFVASALYQLVVPWEQTFGPRPVEKPIRTARHRHRSKM